MISRDEVLANLGRYDQKKARIGVLASHSALDTCDGATSEGFNTLAVCQKGREKTFNNYFRTQRDASGNPVRGVVDDTLILDRFSDVLLPQNQEYLMNTNTLWVPNRSFTSYCSIDQVENDFKVPMVGSRNLLRSEERGGPQDYYWLLEKANLPYPKKIEKPEDIDGLTIIKVHHHVKKLERGFFTAKDYDQYVEKSQELIRQGVLDEDFEKHARMEQYIIGPVFNLDFFYDPLEEKGEKVELLGIDWRFESSLDGYVRLPAKQQVELEQDGIIPEYTVCGHNSATLRESLLDKAFEMAEKYVKATQQYYKPGIIGPFCLQTCVDKDLNFYIYDVAPRIGGGTNVHMSVGHPYGNTLWRTNMSTGRRLSMEVRKAIEQERLEEIIT
ncbi:putative subunit variant of phosphoribosylaminoimidazolecarboxamide formyltransferase [alternate form] [Candidatus Methanomethylophilus alvi Mx1201]|jgi:5-formaminoimidazole-4-carboxamide-1-(beta)-D-ribofuranosyl 5'-monophosphate synthetase|uniref:5-formaminoimidazole-4-carboxamide-1-(Beta)-D-ribofuranosyl 5'-monophosphate synthetase n=2 Tax=Methanomethylophilus alvi TaxID=1291540 RepID=A0A3G3IIU5_9ARCH|nr:formate--phosphoribosylaminoimidazolecarboxamide ligase family protein [Methanomethylophilus alvi]CDF30255.1 iMP biosynthesis enzyme PurP domain protein [Methanoculleus sp. CAG:1088]AGI86112.1 putative subunit variant of phosphoribosylaminoimidazolecarboxamide formyltransferase [alternate form] [Candidatus Methanomethylophilus alvi Mx1201]AYQ55484.1 5-formaminoimidazole-4-carboxamide-1-(beta)-D-ribofuranosyl 5'-monophosphate synthetase [Methanomethylophilus alvi]MCI5974323.1 formate--phospho